MAKDENHLFKNKNHRSILIRDSDIDDNYFFEGFRILYKCNEDSDDDDDDYSYDDYDIEDEDEEIKEEMTPPKVVTSEDGKKSLVVVFKHDWSTLGKRKTPSAFDHDCPICNKPFTTDGNHRVCCLPCGHMYGLSCINSLLQLSQSSGKCPTCNTLCTLKDVRLLYPARTDPTLLKASTKHFPFTKEGLRDFKHYALKRLADALKLRTATLERKTVVVNCMLEALKQRMNEELRRRAQWLQVSPSSSLDIELEHHNTLQQSVYALDREADAFGCRADALRRRADLLKWRAKACKASMNFFEQKYNEHMGWVRDAGPSNVSSSESVEGQAHKIRKSIRIIVPSSKYAEFI